MDGTPPLLKSGQKTVAGLQYDLIADNPYKYTSDEVLFQVFAQRNDLTKGEYKQAREQFFSKGQPCFRASPLTKTFGFGIHYDADGKMASYGMETPEYGNFVNDQGVKKVKAMRSSKK